MRLNPFRSRYRWDKSDFDSRSRGRRSVLHGKVPYFVLALGAGLFALAVAFMMWPAKSDGYASDENSGRIPANSASQSPETRVANDSAVAITDSDVGTTDVTGLTGRAQQECNARREELATRSQSVDRFDLNAVGELNIRIGLYNTDCAGIAGGNQPAGSAATATPPASQPADTAVASKSVAADVKRAPAKRSSSKPVKTKTAATKVAPGKPGSASNRQPAAAPTEASPWSPTVLSVQSLLAKLGYRPGPNDGLMGKRTRDAVIAFQTDRGLAPDGEVNLALLDSILQAYPGESVSGSAAAGKRNTGAKSGTKANAEAGAKTRTNPVVGQASAAPAARVESTSPAAPIAPPRVTTKPADVVTANAATTATPDGGPISLESLNQYDRQTVEWVCASRQAANRDDFDACVAAQLDEARKAGKPDLSSMTAFERDAVTRLCAGARYEKGLAAYYACTQGHQNSLGSVARKPNLGRLSVIERDAVQRNCEGLQFTESLPVYYRCVDSQITAARR